MPSGFLSFNDTYVIAIATCVQNLPKKNILPHVV